MVIHLKTSRSPKISYISEAARYFNNNIIIINVLHNYIPLGMNKIIC